MLMREKPVWSFAPGTDIRKHVRAIQAQGKDGKPITVHEFISTDNFGSAFYERQRFEVDAGRDLEPLLYSPFYQILEDSTLPRLVNIDRFGPANVVFSVIQEGGEVKFLTVGGTSFSVPISQYAVGVEYSKALVMFNEMWSLAEVERQVGVAYNALLNHIHLYPIISGTYGANNYTDAAALTFESGATQAEKYHRTIEAAITAAVADGTNPRRGPYGLLVPTGQSFAVERALTSVPQQGFSRQSAAASRISVVVAYDGWTGSRGNLVTTYPGVDAGYAYMVDLGLRSRNFRSYVKQGLQRTSGNPDVSRFILEQTVWDSWLGNYADYPAGVHRIKWPT